MVPPRPFPAPPPSGLYIPFAAAQPRAPGPIVRDPAAGAKRTIDPGSQRVSITCPECGAEYDVTLFAFGRSIHCDCGATVRLQDPLRPAARDGSAAARELQRRGDALTWTILYSDLPSIDVDLAIESLREWVRARLPDRLALFDMVWVARWERLRAQGWARGSSDL